MGKIDDFEKKLINDGINDENLTEYKQMLKRVPGNFLKRQHCYTTAIQFSAEYAEQAIALIQYGLEAFEDGWFTTYTSHVYIGHIYEGIGDYQKAYDSYTQARSVLGSDHPEYYAELAKEIMWMRLHIDSFNYSEELENLLDLYKQFSDDFDKAILNNEFKITVASIVVSVNHGRIDEAKHYLESARNMCRPGYIGRLYNILKRHNYEEDLKATRESVAFVKRLKI